jgi:PemK-like, MazF-like toxin of type II toxin-antitoxin system
MKIPGVGAVIRYAYLWAADAASGHDEGVKDRPCVVVVSTVDEDGERVLLVMPITHSPPTANDLAVELPSMTKRRIGLDDQRSWIVTSEYNRFIWPGPDIRPDASGEVVLGLLPSSLIERAARNLRAHAAAGRATRAIRD